MRHRIRNSVVALLVCLTLVSTVGAASRRVVVESARTRVGIAKVILQLGALTLHEGGLVGTYAIRVPLAPSRGDTGTITIALDSPLGDEVVPGNTVHGTASSSEDGQVHDVVCTFKESGRVRIVVSTPKRTLAFEAPYTIGN